MGGKSWIHTESASALDATQCDVHEQTSSGMTALGHDEFFQILDFTLMNEKSMAFVTNRQAFHCTYVISGLVV